MPRRLLLATTILTTASLAPGAADGARFILSDGEVVEGRVIAATRNTLTVLRDVGGIHQIARTSLERVQVDTPRGTVVGLIRRVEGGRVLIDTPAGNTIWVEGDRVIAEEEPARPTISVTEVVPRARSAAPAEGGPSSARGEPVADAPSHGSAAADRPAGNGHGARVDPAPAGPAPVLADPGPSPRQRGLVPGRSFGGLVSEAAAAPAGEAAKSAPPRSGPPLVRIVVDEPQVGEDAGRVGFHLELSHASEQPIRLVYSTVDGQANAGRDYEASQGVFTLAPGETRRSLESAILDDGDTEDPEQFFLFVTTDAEHATIEEKWYTVTIQDND